MPAPPSRSRPVRAAILAAAFASVTALACSRDGNQPDDPQPSSAPTDPATPTAQATGPETPPAASHVAAPELATHDPMAPEHPAPPVTSTCPMLLEGVVVEAADTPDGVALQFTCPDGDVEQLRGRVEHMAHMYASHPDGGGMMWQHMGHMRGEDDQPGMGRMGGSMPAATASVETIDHGARSILTPRDPAELPALRAQVREHQRRMTDHECPVPAA